MTDDAPVVEPESGQEAEPQEPKMFDLNYVQELRQEAANWRTRLREREQKDKDAEQERLAKQSEWQKLAEQRAAEIEELSPYRDRYNTMLETVAESNTKRVETIPEAMRGLVPDFDDPLKLSTWLDANSQLLTKPLAPALNGEAGSGGRPTEVETLSAEELRAARRMGITAKEYQDAKRG